jgi:cellulose synthase/poly-beta-1,6-N-acetylglucosamine synthase-like glycosyltransferase
VPLCGSAQACFFFLFQAVGVFPASSLFIHLLLFLALPQILHTFGEQLCHLFLPSATVWFGAVRVFSCFRPVGVFPASSLFIYLFVFLALPQVLLTWYLFMNLGE